MWKAVIKPSTIAILITILCANGSLGDPLGIKKSIAASPAAKESNPKSDSAPKEEQRGDSANRADTVKSWTSQSPPGGCDKSFLNRLEWENHRVGAYVLRTGKIYGRWVAAMQWMKNGRLVLTEYTPPCEYVTALDPASGKPLNDFVARDVNNDGVLEMAFLHEKLTDPNYHMYTVYGLAKAGPPKLLWKSGGKFGDWLHQVERPAGEVWQTKAVHED